MNTVFFRLTSSLVGLAVLGVIFSGLSAQAQMGESPEVTPFSSENLDAVTQSDGPTITVEQIDTVEPVASTPAENTPEVSDAQLASLQPQAESGTELAPSTSAAGLVAEPSTSKSSSGAVAQFDTPAPSPEPGVSEPIDVDPGQATVSSPSYIGVGVGFDFDDDTGLAVLSKVGLSDRLSVRPSVVTEFNDSASIRVPLTLDFTPRSQVGGFNISPYIGAGAVFAVGGDTDIGPLVTAGVDVPLTPRFTGTAALNVGFVDDTEFGAYVGVGYNFPGLFQ